MGDVRPQPYSSERMPIQNLVRSASRRRRPVAQRAYTCRCGKPVFFPNTRCLSCQAELGYEPHAGRVLALERARQADHVHAAGGGPYRLCANRATASACNWLAPAGPAPTFCAACRLNRTIPDLSVPENGELWHRIELAKRRLLSLLIALGLPVQSNMADDPARGLAFDFLRAAPGGDAITTGHQGGVITLDIEEADDSKRERIRARMREPYRTLLGHLRHEVGHYYWFRLIDDSEWIEPFRALFGDERADYPGAIAAHHRNGAPPDWPQRFVSAYASAHPWEDWAESWAHYLHLVDTFDSALSYGLEPESVQILFEAFDRSALWQPDDPDADAFLRFVNAWAKFTAALNELSRGMGQHDFYPFVLSKPVVAKLQFVHLAIGARSGLRKQRARQRGQARARDEDHEAR